MWQVGFRLSSALAKTLLEEEVETRDLEAVDPQLYTGLQWILNTPGGAAALDAAFVMQIRHPAHKQPAASQAGTAAGPGDSEDHAVAGGEGGWVVEEVELEPGGRNRQVTEENKAEYVAAYARHRLVTAPAAGCKAFEKGLFAVVDAAWVRVFSAAELELLLCGVSRVDPGDWKAHARYSGHTAAGPLGPNSPLALW